MLIDWFTVAAQVVNFIILIWLMKRFLYKPILHAIDAREKIIAAQLADAEAAKAEAKSERDEFQRKNAQFDGQRNAMLSEATVAAQAEGQRLMEQARSAANAMSAKHQEALRSDAEALNKTIMLRTGQEVFAIARKALNDLAGVTLEERMCAVFISRVHQLDNAAKSSLAEAITTASDPVALRTVFELEPEQREIVQKALNEIFATDVHISFETATEQVCGIELVANGQKVAWSISEYLVTLQQEVEELLQVKQERQENDQDNGQAKTD
ncbi:MAG: hypothetical protein RBR43_08250 [Desulfuromonadaceae bacterium]|nr:hypothetical protein [Desulfuromonadaceae bacterium]